MNVIFLIIGGSFALIWGASHLFPTKDVVNDFGDISTDNRNIIVMEWINEGATLIFLGLLTIVLALTHPTSPTSTMVFWLIIGMLILMAVISLFTGFKVNFLPFKLCPLIFTLSALCIFLGIVL